MKSELEYIQANFKEQIRNKPKKLYKYKCLNSNTIDSIRNDYLWLSKPSVLNDTFESFVNADFNPNKLINFAEDYQFFSDEHLTKLWHERVEKGENIIEVLKQMTDEIKNKDEKILAKDKLYYCYKNMCEFYMQSSLDFTELIDKSFLIGSLTTNPLSITMWSHYADSHNGVCIEYNLAENPYIEKMVLPVIYTDTTLSHDDIFERELLLYAMLFKSPDWKYEDEWRVIVPTQDNRFYAKPSAIYLGAKGWHNDEILKDLQSLTKEKKIDLHIVHKSYSSYRLEEMNLSKTGNENKEQ